MLRETLSPFALLMTGRRRLDDYSDDEAVADYLEMHPEATEVEVRATIAADRKRDDEGTLPSNFT